MALDVSPGGPTADSYASLADALAYHAAKGNAAWAAADDADREPALRRATAWVDAAYRARWTGTRVNGRTQALDWPRAGVIDSDGWAIDHLTIPAEVVSATCEAALRELAAPGSLLPDVVPGAMKILTGVDALTWTPLRASAGVGDMAPVLTIVDGILARIIGGNRNSVGLVRG